MSSLSTLLLFCDYLETRLHTSSLELLRRIFADFFAGNEHTLQDFMRLGASVVSVMPVEKKGPRHQKEAARLLTEQMDTTGQLQPQEDTQEPHPCVFHYLSARVATKNILRLGDLYQEFCKGDDTLLEVFVHRGDEAITVIPVDIQALRMVPLPPPPLMMSAVSNSGATDVGAATASTTASGVSTSPALSRQRKRRKGSEQQVEREIEAAEHRTRKQSRRVSTGARQQQAEHTVNSEPSLRGVPTPLGEIRQVLVTAVQRLEEKEPWKYAFSPENLVMPFSRAKHPALVESLLEFWKANARAVWERKFWSPLSCSSNYERHTQRRCRQSKAQGFFEKNVLLPVYKELGAGFFVKMDLRTECYSGWYYLGQAVDLFTLAQRCGLPKCLQYMESEASKRFPVAPGVSRNFFSRVNGKSRSMWSSSDTLQPVLDEIVAMKAKKRSVGR